jgi:hypothetical protein
MPTNQSPQDSPPLYGTNQQDYISNPYANQQPIPTSNSYLPAINFSSTSRANPSAMNLDTPTISSTFLHSSEMQQRQSYHPPSSTSINKESIPHAKRARSDAYNDELNPEDADLDSDHKEGPNRSKL